MFYQRMHRYPAGSKVQHRNGYIRVKTTEATWVGEHRLLVEQRGDCRGKKGPLSEGEKVFHLDGLPDTNQVDNLVRIQYNTVRFKLLKESRVLFIPKFSAEEQTHHHRAQANKLIKEAIWNGKNRRRRQINWTGLKDRRHSRVAVAA